MNYINAYKDPPQPHFKADQASLILESFILFDTNKDGKLSTKEVVALVKQMFGMQSQTQIYKNLSEIDTKYRGFITQEQFLAFMEKLLMTVSSDKDIQQSFKLFEQRGQKGITFASLKQTFNNAHVELNSEEIRKVILQMDQTGNGKINYEEFKKIMKK